jgi:predicted MFS family arabinose efflux permease
MFGMFFVVTQYLQSVLGYSPLEAGLRVVPWAAVYMVSAPLSARLVERWGQRRVVSTGLTVVATGLALLSRSGSQAHYPLLALALMFTAAGMGMTTAPSTGAIMVSLPLDKAGVGSAVNDTTRELGGALGVAVFGSVVASQYHADLAHRLAGLPGAAGAANASLGSALQTAAALPRPAAQALSSGARQAYVHALDTTLLVAVGVALLAAALVRWLLRPSSAEVQAVEDTIALQAA